MRRCSADGRIVQTKIIGRDVVEELRREPSVERYFRGTGPLKVLEHERIPFPSFPYEWPPEMLHAAGGLTVDLARDLLADGLGLKDATPYNVLFRGPQPVFVDVLSVERRDQGDSMWLPYAQYVRTFLLPLLANKHCGMPLDQIFMTRRDGLDPEDVYRWLRPLQRIRPPFLSLISMPTWLGSRHDQDDSSIYETKASANPEKAHFILDTLLKNLRRALDRLAPSAKRRSTWSNYMTGNNNYAAEQFQAKHLFVEEALKEFEPKSVLDVGCNTGHFSTMAARSGAAVVSIDYDPAVLGQVWRQAKAEDLNILPLAVNLARPTPGTGWRNQECPSFLDRATGHFDAVLMLAVIHHMQVTERVPLTDIIDLAARLTRNIVIIEFIGPQDSMFRRLTRGREELHAGLTQSAFESACKTRFEIVRSQLVAGTERWLYVLQRRA